jgi:hypothetical protein
MSAAASCAGALAPAGEAALAHRWAAGLRHAARLEDGRSLRVVFPGIPGGGAGPDFRDAILDAGGDLLRGDVEVHRRASGWRAHGHDRDPAYAGVALHVVAENDSGATATRHGSGRAIPILVLATGPLAGAPGLPPGFTPPCALTCARGRDPLPALERLGARRLRMKAARVEPLVTAAGPAQALYALLLETLAGPANRAAFAALARRLPLAALLERAAEAPAGPGRALVLAAELKGAAATLSLRRAGLRPLAAPGRRLEAAGALCARLWPGVLPAWPDLPPGAPGLLRALRAPGIGRGAAIELAVNALLPVAFAARLVTAAGAEDLLRSLPSPGTYGRLRRLEGWLAAGAKAPFGSASRLQGGLLLHADYCSRGECGRCPVSG